MSAPSDSHSFDSALDFEADEVVHTDEPYTITDPFDPRQIDISVEVQNVRYLLDLLEDDVVDLNSEFQRSRDLWTASKMSRFIESLIVRLPIPPFYLALPETIPTNVDNRIQIVDGLQRLSTLHRFVVCKDPKKQLRLTDLELLPALKGKSFGELDRPIQRSLERAQVTLYLIRPNTPKPVKYIIFNRMNTGGLTLNDQEVRHALNPGAPAKYLDELISLPSFRHLIRLHHPRMRDQELALRFIAFRLTEPRKYKRGLKKFLDDAMDAIGRCSPSLLQDLKVQFDNSLSAAASIFGNFAFSRKLDQHPQLNKALFDSWTVNLSLLTDFQINTLICRKDLLLDPYRMHLKSGSPFETAISKDTSSPESVTTRFETVKSLIFETISANIPNDR